MKQYLRLFGGKAKMIVLVLAGWLALHGAALAKAVEKKKDEGGGGEGGSYVLPYALVILGIALGMLFVCRSCNRRDRARPEKYGDAKVVGEEK